MQGFESGGVRALVSGLVETVFAAAYVVAVYELVVAGGIALWSTATDAWILQMWIVAAVICGIGLKPVRALARLLLLRLWPVAGDPYAALASFVAAASAADHDQDAARDSAPDGDRNVDDLHHRPALRRLAQLAVAGTGAQAAAVWCREVEGTLFLAARWPDDDSREVGESVADLSELASSPGVDHLVSVLDAGELLGALALTVAPTRGLTPRDDRLAANMANAAGPLLRNAELTARLADQVRRQTDQAVELDRSRRRVLAARDAAREQLGREIGANVGDPLSQCSATVSAMLDDNAGRTSRWGEQLAEMAALIDSAIGDFRRIVHGVYPAVLTDHGLASALENLLNDLPRRATFNAPSLPRLAARTESGVYFCVTAMVGSLPAGTDRPLRVDVDLDETTLTVVIHDGDQPSGSPESAPSQPMGLPDFLRDRVEALEGVLHATSGRDWTRYELRVPVKATEESVADEEAVASVAAAKNGLAAQ
jgi:signal transduction histidine kinase